MEGQESTLVSSPRGHEHGVAVAPSQQAPQRPPGDEEESGEEEAAGGQQGQHVCGRVERLLRERRTGLQGEDQGAGPPADTCQRGGGADGGGGWDYTEQYPAASLPLTHSHHLIKCKFI